MGKRLQYKRLLMLTLLLAAAFAGLGYRLVDLQVLEHEELSQEAENNTHYTYRMEARRGSVLDVKGNLLATSVFVKTIFADPMLIGTHAPEVARAIAPLLQMPETELIQKLTPKTHVSDKGQNLTNRYVVLKKKVPSDVWEKIQERMDKLTFGVNEKYLPKKEQAFYKELRQKAISTEQLDDQLREYPNSNLACHVLGFVGVTERTNSRGVRSQEIVGKDGIEYFMNAELKGVGGLRVTERDGQHREVVSLREEDVAPHDGYNVVLTIDSVIQHYVEVAIAQAMHDHSPTSVCCIVMRPQTGEILAMAVCPNYDPNNPGVMPDPSAERNRITFDMMEPGSTFKSVVVASALNDGIVKLTDQFDCEHGHFAYAGRILHDHESYGVLTVEYVVAKSSNIGAAKIGILMGQERLYEHLKEFGFGEKTGIELPWEASGILHPLSKWKRVSIAQIPMGQGVAVTPLQMAMAMGALANKGMLMRPMLVSALQEPDGTVFKKYVPHEVHRVISEQADREIIQALKTVVTDGTAKNAAMTNYTVAGKTGTAQKSDGHKYLEGKYYASFFGFFPADNPEICIYVSMDDPKGALHQGGQVAAPVFKEIAEKVANYLNIRPDKGADSGLPDALSSVKAEPPLKTVAAARSN